MIYSPNERQYINASDTICRCMCIRANGINAFDKNKRKINQPQ